MYLFHCNSGVSLWLAPPWKQVQLCYCSLCPAVTIEAGQDCTKLLSLQGSCERDSLPFGFQAYLRNSLFALSCFSWCQPELSQPL